MAFKKAVKRKLKARVAIDGPTGSGKTYTGLKLLRALVGAKGKVAVIDTEHKTASKYLGDAIDTFDVQEFETFEPTRYIQAIKDAEEAGYDGLLIDSYSHAWAGKGGALEQVDAAAARMAASSRSGKEDKFGAWREVTPMHNDLVEAMIRFPGHLVVTMRSKMAYEKGSDGKVHKLGLQPIQRDGVEYEFDVVCDMDLHHNLVVSKTRCRSLDNKLFKKPTGEDIAKPLLKWLNEGAAEAAPVQTPAPESAPASVADAHVSDPLAPGVDPESMVKQAAMDLGAEIETAYDQGLKAIDGAKNMDELKAAAGLVKGLKLSPSDRKLLLESYKLRAKSLG